MLPRGTSQRRACRALAQAMLAGEWSREAMLERAAGAVSSPEARLAPLVDHTLATFPASQARPALRTLAELLQRTLWPGAPGEEDPPRAEAQDARPPAPEVVAWFLPRAEMRPVPAAAAWPVPQIRTAAELAQLCRLPELTLEGLSGQLHPPPQEARGHYHYRWRAKPRGGLRLLEAPKELLKRTQRRLLRLVLAAIPVHAAAQGFVLGRSARTHAALHAGQQRVLRLDLAHFFPSIRAARVHGIFAACGYPEAVARRLAGLCTHAVPSATWRRLARDAGQGAAAWEDGKHYTARHLPQGAPTSPALANLCAFKLDRRLAGLAAAEGLIYSRYADDLALSGSRRALRSPARLAALVARIAREEGFRVRADKTCLMGQGGRQQLVGLVVNTAPHWPRDQYDRLRAILHNCRRRGPRAESRGDPLFAQRLRGLIAHVAHLQPGRGARLLAAYGEVDWGELER